MDFSLLPGLTLGLSLACPKDPVSLKPGGGGDGNRRGKERSAVGEGWRWTRLSPCCLGPCLLPAGQEAGRGPQGHESEAPERSGQEGESADPEEGDRIPAPYPILEETSPGASLQPPLALWVPHGQNRIKKHTSAERSLEERLDCRTLSDMLCYLGRHHQGSLGLPLHICVENQCVYTCH